MESKHRALQDWVADFLENNYLYFESADAYPNVRIVVPDVGDYVVRTDILGNKYKSYSFVFVGYEQIDTGTSDINVLNLEVMDEFNDWIVEQQEYKNFPDFGPKCSEYELTPLQNMANLAMLSEDGLAKYMLGVRIDYKEEE